MSEFPHFRMYRKNKHPAMIVGEIKIKKEKDGFLYRKTSHSSGVTKRGVDILFPNPDPKDNNPMYVERRRRKDFKFKFGPILPWNKPKK